MAKQNILDWIQKWYTSQCNQDWEHSYGIRIDTLDNPGWQVTIDLNETNLQTLVIPYKLVENSENDWYSVEVKDFKFNANGDPTKLEFLLSKFREIAESKSSA